MQTMHSFRARILFWMLLVTVTMLSACDRSEGPNIAHNPQVEERASALLDAIKAQDFDKVIAQYDESFLDSHDPKLWVDQLKAYLAERGPMQSYILRKSQADTRFSGKFYILEYESVHDGNKRLHHLITIRSHVEGGKIQLIGHKITPWEKTP